VFFFIKKRSFNFKELLLNVVRPIFKERTRQAKQALRIWPKPKGIFWFQLRIHLPPYNLIPGLKYLYLKMNKEDRLVINLVNDYLFEEKPSLAFTARPASMCCVMITRYKLKGK
jgi:hypothetical protein